MKYTSYTSAIRTQTPGNYPKENILHIEHGESLKSRIHKSHLKLIKTVKVVSSNSMFCHNCYQCCLHILLPLSFHRCHSMISSPSISMWNHSKYSYVSALPSTIVVEHISTHIVVI